MDEWAFLTRDGEDHRPPDVPVLVRCHAIDAWVEEVVIDKPSFGARPVTNQGTRTLFCERTHATF
ncbi:MAG: hypothetical protein QOH16_1423 [Gaiellaceae bacterium]|jgi:hypothetical protein|nr:hypothetical protein [Gaiellaceae bacterium]